MNNWCLSLTLFQKLVCKVDQLVKRRAKSGLIRVNVDWSDAKEFINQHLGKEIKVRLVSSYWGFLESKELVLKDNEPNFVGYYKLDKSKDHVIWTKLLDGDDYSIFSALEKFSSVQTQLKMSEEGEIRKRTVTSSS